MMATRPTHSRFHLTEQPGPAARECVSCGILLIGNLPNVTTDWQAWKVEPFNCERIPQPAGKTITLAKSNAA